MAPDVRTCVPTCKSFRCAKKSLRTFSDRIGRWNALCIWVGDPCQGYKCQYALCLKRALLPDGHCNLEIRRPAEAISIEDEAMKLEEDYRKIRGKFKRLRISPEELE